MQNQVEIPVSQESRSSIKICYMKVKMYHIYHSKKNLFNCGNNRGSEWIKEWMNEKILKPLPEITISHTFDFL